MNKKILLSLFLGIFLMGIVSAVGVSYCCEKTTNGAWCQNEEDEASCDQTMRSVPTSCESTAYCKRGCCYNSHDGTCMENTPQKVCEEPGEGLSGGIWSAEANCEIPQCSLGCCLIGDQAAFVTQTRCKGLAASYGLEISFRTDIENEMTCISSATSDVKGACVFEQEFETTCLFISQRECNELGTTENDVSFHRDYLCSSYKLGTNCVETKKTTCVEGRDEVFFVDSCGNLANIYDATQVDNQEYWSKVYTKSDSCSLGLYGEEKCGNCDYFAGSTCQAHERGKNTRPDEGGNVCVDLSCEYDTDGSGSIDSDEQYSHGETWCAKNKGVSDIRIDNEGEITSTGENLPGGRYFRLICYNGEVTIEPCADFRQEVCLQSEVNGFKTAACRTNMWEGCLSQDNRNDCENTDKRDCVWIWGPLASDYNEEEYNKGDPDKEKEDGYSCVPRYSPGLDFWVEETDADELCGIASTQCLVTYKADWAFDNPDKDLSDVDQNRACILPGFEPERKTLCSSLGDCGVSKNYYGLWGYETEDAYSREEIEREG